MGGFVFVVVVAGVGRRGRPLRGGWSHSPPVGEGGDVRLFLCFGVWVVGMVVLVIVAALGGGYRVVSVVLVLGGCLVREGWCWVRGGGCS